MTFDWHMLYPLHTVILDNSQVFGGVPYRAQLCNFSKWFFSPRFGVVPIWELWQFCYVRIEPPKPHTGGSGTVALGDIRGTHECPRSAQWLGAAPQHAYWGANESVNGPR